MERKDSENRDNFFASLNQLILSLEPAIKEAGSVSAAEDILTHLEATDENFHRFVNMPFCLKTSSILSLNKFIVSFFSIEIIFPLSIRSHVLQLIVFSFQLCFFLSRTGNNLIDFYLYMYM